jgi:ParB family transcriptional regulator, chromosome partitioning protein
MAELLKQGTLPVGYIGTGHRLRPVSETGVTSLVDSIRQAGVMKDDIHVRCVTRRTNTGKEDSYWLIAGAHRLEAAKRLDWAEVPVKIWRCSDDWARLLEIDDNLAHAELSSLELATFLAERKRVHLRLFPQSARGAAGAAARWGDASDTVSFASTIAEKRDMSVRHVERLIRIGEALSAPQLKALQELPKPPSMRELITLSSLDSTARDAVLSSVTPGAGLKDALKAAQPDKPEPLSRDEQQFRALQEAWARANAPARRRFVGWVGSDIDVLREPNS